MNANTRGALLMMGSMAAFTVNDTFVKLTGGDVPLFQLVFLRGALTSLCLLVLAQSLGMLRFGFSKRDWALIGVRSGAELAATVFFLSALFQMPLANVTAVLQILPLSVALGAALFLGETVGWRRWLAIAVGFCGMLLIVRPGPEGFSTATLFALLTVVFATLRDLVTRRITPSTPSMMVSLAAAVSITMFSGAASAFQGWEAVSLSNGVYIVAAAGCILVAYLCSVMVMRVGEISFTAPFRYTGLIWALTLGYLIWGDWPTNLTLLGAFIVVSMGIFTLVRENRLARKNAAHRV